MGNIESTPSPKQIREIALREAQRTIANQPKKLDLNLLTSPRMKKSATTLLENFDDYVLYQDDDILVVNKPQGMVSYGSLKGGRPPVGLQELATAALGKQEAIHTGHRLDMDTTGVIILGKHPEAYVGIKQQFADKAKSGIEKHYAAFLDGEFLDDATQEVSVGIQEVDRNRMRAVPLIPDKQIEPGVKASLTYFTPTELFETGEDRVRTRTLTDIEIVTGRRHQIRVTAAEQLRKPITGDQMYNKNSRHGELPFLHAAQLAIKHPITDEPMVFAAPFPHHFERLRSQMDSVLTYKGRKS